MKDYDVSLVIPGLPFDGETLEKKSLGGSESAAIYMARALARAGANVNVFCNTENAGQAPTGERYLPLGLWGKYGKSTPHDVAIIQRVPELLSQRTAARLNLFWVHDLAHGRQGGMLKAVAWNVDKILVLSRFMLDQWRAVHGFDEDRFFVTRNGIDLATVSRAADGLRAQMDPPGRDRKRLIYTSRPERGLDVLLRDVMPRLLKADPEIRLAIGGYENPVPHLSDLYEECARLAAGLGDRVQLLPPLHKEALYREYLLSGCYVYPTPSPSSPKFREISCITAMECMASALPFVASDCGALRETVGEPLGGLLAPLKDGAVDVDGIVSRVLSVVQGDPTFLEAQSAGLERAALLDWAGVAEDWLAMFEREIRSRSADPARAVRHFWRVSDIYAAKAALPEVPEAERAPLESLLEPFAFVDEPEGFRKQYERIGETHGDQIEPTAEEPRFKILEDYLRKHPELVTVIDYGCAYGGYSVLLAERLKGVHFLGLDIDKHGIALARKHAEARGVADRAHFQVLDVMNGDPADVELHGSAACVLLQEVLEHVAEPWTLAERAEKFAAKGGVVHITVPFGPWEHDSYHTYPHRAHVWHFDRHDVTDMFGKKPGFNVNAFYYGDGITTGEPLGWWIVTYKADHGPVGRIDMERKRWLQKPRQSLSVGIIAGPGCEETLAWTLRSVYQVADEILIGDCGMGQALTDVLAMLEKANPIWGWSRKVRVLPGAPNPVKEGFERARNFVLDAATCDWFLWIDSDERLIGSTSIWKYLRENAFHGYGVRQHHFAVDTTFSPDMPVRFFRRRPYQGQTLRFWGAIHEHPELSINGGPGPVVVLSDVHIAHAGYLVEDVRQRRFLRNWPMLKLDQERYPERLLQKHFLMRDNIHLVRYALSQNGGKVDGYIQEKCRETIKLFREHFLGKSGYTGSDSIQYYSEALKVLGEGFEAAFQIEADAVEAKVNGTSVYRFANAEEYVTTVTHMVREKASRFDAEYW